MLSLSKGLIPANTGCRVQDPKIRLALVDAPMHRTVQTVLTNAFGFGGNNAALVFGTPEAGGGRSPKPRRCSPLRIAAEACLTGAGPMAATLARIDSGEGCAGTLSTADVSEGLAPRLVRRFKRLPRMALSLAVAACGAGGAGETPAAVFWGTGWGPLTETHDFLDALFASDKKFAGPTDFVGSVHNAPAGHIAMHFKSRGPNITTTGGDASFVQALLLASLLAHEIDGPFLIVGADEYHPRFSSLFDPSTALSATPSDGGAALRVRGAEDAADTDVGVWPAVLVPNHDFSPADMVVALGGGERIGRDIAAVFVDMPAAWRQAGGPFLDEFLSAAGFGGPVFDVRRHIGEFASAGAVAVALAVASCRRHSLPGPSATAPTRCLERRGILVLGIGTCLSAVEVTP